MNCWALHVLLSTLPWLISSRMYFPSTHKELPKLHPQPTLAKEHQTKRIGQTYAGDNTYEKNSRATRTKYTEAEPEDDDHEPTGKPPTVHTAPDQREGKRLNIRTAPDQLESKHPNMRTAPDQLEAKRPIKGSGPDQLVAENDNISNKHKVLDSTVASETRPNSNSHKLSDQFYNEDRIFSTKCTQDAAATATDETATVSAPDDPTVSPNEEKTVYQTDTSNADHTQDTTIGTLQPNIETKEPTETENTLDPSGPTEPYVQTRNPKETENATEPLDTRGTEPYGQSRKAYETPPAPASPDHFLDDQ